MSAEKRTIVVETVGPGTKPTVIPVQPGGTILTGFCGLGKTKTLEAIAVAFGNKDVARPKPTRGYDRGSVDCLGVVLSISDARVTRSGELEADALEEFDIGSLIDPPVKSEESRNACAIKSLLRMNVATADPALFHHLLGGKEAFDAMLPPDAVKSADLVDMAGKIKRALENVARASEDEAAKEETAAATKRHAVDGLDLLIETDAEKLQAAHSAAVSAHTRADEQARSYRQAVKRRAEAEEELEKSAGEYMGPSVADAEVAYNDAMEERGKAVSTIDHLQKRLDAAKADWQLFKQKSESADEALKAAKAHDKALVDFRGTLATTLPPAPPTQEAIDELAQTVETARVAMENAAVLRAAQEKLKKADQHAKNAAGHHKEAKRLRDAAKDTDTVLSRSVASSRFVVVRGVLIGVLPNGDHKPFFDLSDGERTLLACAEKIDRVQAAKLDPLRIGIVDLPQRTFQDLPQSVRDTLFVQAADAECCLVTAQVTDGRELAAEVVDVAECRQRLVNVMA